ncbi:MAG: metallophosphoesterase family protein [bacterium]
MNKSIGVISDTHISNSKEHINPEVFTILNGVSAIFHSGDITHDSVLQDLETIAPVYAVGGNMDPPDIQQALPKSLTVELFGKIFGIIHGWGSHYGLIDKVKSHFHGQKLDCIVFGHSHEATIHREDNILFFNPGSLRNPKGFRTLGILELTRKAINPKIIKF